MGLSTPNSSTLHVNQFVENPTVVHKTMSSVNENTATCLWGKSTVVHLREVFLAKEQLEVACSITALTMRKDAEDIPPTGKTSQVIALVDSGCTGSVIDDSFASSLGLQKIAMETPIRVVNADGTVNKGGPLTHFVRISLDIAGHQERISLPLASLKSHQMFLGHDWLKFHNPTVNWNKGLIKFNQCPRLCTLLSRKEDDTLTVNQQTEEFREAVGELEDGDTLYAMNIVRYLQDCSAIHLRYSSTLSEFTDKSEFQERVPTEYHKYESVFSKDDFDQLPE